MRFALLFVVIAATVSAAEPPTRKTAVSIRGEAFHINGAPTYHGQVWKEVSLEGLLLNSRMVQGIFDDLNPDTRGRWKYPDTGVWDVDRNTREFLAGMPAWREHGLNCFTINLQGGSPQGYSKQQPWHNSALTETGELRPDYLGRLEKILNRADELGFVVILGVFYFGQDERLRDEAAVKNGVRRTIDWVFDRGYTNVLLEVNNECNVAKYDHAILKADRVHELIVAAQRQTRGERRLLVSASYGGGAIPRENVAQVADFLLLHGNGVKVPARITEMVRQTRQVCGQRTLPILFNEDDHFDFEQPENNFVAAVRAGAGWGYFDPGRSDYVDGYQCPPVNWGLNTERKRAFFRLVRDMTQEKAK